MSDDFKGSGSAALRAVIVVGALLILGGAGFLGYMLGGGEWFVTAVRQPSSTEVERPGPAVSQPSEAGERGVEPSVAEAGGTAVDRADSQPGAPGDASDAVPPVAEGRPVPGVASPEQPSPIAPAAPELPEEPVEPVVPVEPVESVEPEAVDTERLDRAAAVVGDLLATRTPLEVRDVDLGQQELVRTVTVAGRQRRVIWGLPEQDSHASHISYVIDAGYERLRGVAMVVPWGVERASDTGGGPAGIFRLYGDSNLLWESAPVRGHGASQPFDVMIRNVEVLVLVVENLTPGTEAGFVWADLELLGEPAS